MGQDTFAGYPSSTYVWLYNFKIVYFGEVIHFHKYIHENMLPRSQYLKNKTLSKFWNLQICISTYSMRRFVRIGGMGYGGRFFLRCTFINMCVGLQHALRVVQFMHMSYGKIRPHIHIYIYIFSYIPIFINTYPNYTLRRTKFVLGADA